MTIKIKAQGALPAALVSAQGLGVSSAIAPGLPADQTSGELLTRPTCRPSLWRTGKEPGLLHSLPGCQEVGFRETLVHEHASLWNLQEKP